MGKRPLLIKILVILHFLQPIINIIYLKFTTTFSWSTILNNLLQLDSIKSNFDFWFLFPIAGIALLLVKRWSFFIFLAVQIYSIYLHLFYEKFTWPYVSEHPLTFSIILLICNISFVAYAFLPNIRQLFFDKTKRWWETSNRYFINTPCKLSIISKGTHFESKIINLSKTGAFIESTVNLAINEIISINFNYNKKNYSLTGKLISNHQINNITGMGIKFILDKFHADEKILIKLLIKSISKKNKKVY